MRSIEIPQPQDRTKAYRFFEVMPAILTFLVLSLPILLARYNPKADAYFILLYMMLWFVRAMNLNVYSFRGWKTLSQHKAQNWQKLNKDLEDLTPRHLTAPKWHAKNIARVAKYIPESKRIKPSEVYHAIIICFWNESLDVLEPTIESVIKSNYDLNKVILLMAYEQRGGEKVQKDAETLIKKYSKNFYHAEAVMHPWPMFGEVVGKGGNATYAGRRLEKILKEKSIDADKVLVTTLDADNHPDKEYLGALTYTYCSTEEPLYASYQPLPMYTNNIWDAPAPMRVIATGNTIWNMMLSLRPHMLRNFSAHAQPMSALIETDFWSTRTIVEDGHQYWRSFFRFDGKHTVYPIYVPIYQDAVLTDKYVRTLKAQFVQVRRWAWGASDIAYVAYQGFMKKNNVPKLKLIRQFLALVESHLGWSTAPLLILLSSRLLLYIQPQNYLANQLPLVASWVAKVAMIGILVTLYITFKSLPPKPLRYKKHRTLFMWIQWIYLPVTAIVYSSFAAIYSQVRLMFGWYLGFVVTEKAVKKD